MSITFEVFQEDAGFVAKWDAPMNMGGITTQADSLPELFKAITEAVQCHFDEEGFAKRDHMFDCAIFQRKLRCLSTRNFFLRPWKVFSTKRSYPSKN
jgi:predicted RNase H-like HicB family nuclease